jgi:hypothetical protein
MHDHMNVKFHFFFLSWALQALLCKLYLVLFDVYKGIFHKKLENLLAHCEVKWTELPRLHMFSHHAWTTVCVCWCVQQLFFLKLFLSVALDNNHTTLLDTLLFPTSRISVELSEESSFHNSSVRRRKRFQVVTKNIKKICLKISLNIIIIIIIII